MGKRGYVTIPTDADLVEKTKYYLDYWGADAIRDCDGVKLPSDLKQFNCDVYKAYFIVREDHEYAKAHPEYLQNVAIITDRQVAFTNSLTIDLLANLFKKSLEVNLDN